MALSADGMIMAIGATGYLRGTKLSYVKVYHMEGEGSSWKQLGDTVYGQASDIWGMSLALSGDGKALAVGVSSIETGEGTGQVKVYEWDEAALN